MATTLTPILTGTPGQPPSYSVGMAETFSWVPIENNADRPLFARAGYITNLKDLSISLSASDINIGGVEIVDGVNHNLRVSLAPLGGSNGNALKTVTTNPVTAVSVINTVSAVSITNPVSAVSITNPVTAVSVTNTVSAVSITNPVTAVSIIDAITAVSITNPVTAVSVTNPVTAVSVVNTVAVSGSIVATVDSTQGFPVTLATSTNLDAFGRLRTSAPLTLFDSSHRYGDNGLWASLTAVNASTSFNQNQGLVDLTVNGLSGSSVIRETTKVFSYQPGKSLLILDTFTMAPSSTNLRQRVGYFGQDNGVYFQLSADQLSFVKRTKVGGSVSETVVPVSEWNGDKLNGTGSSGLTIDITKSQIFWLDVEWLGVGTVRTGFVIDGKYITCHSFHHANKIDATYITTASLPLRYEITNVGATGSSHTMKQICSTVISEGGYELRGSQQSQGTPIATARQISPAVITPIVSLRLKSDKLDAIVVPTALNILPKTNSRFYKWRLIAGGTTTGGAGWQDAGTYSAVEYKLDSDSITGGRVVASGYVQGSAQGATSVFIPKDALFRFQLERNSFTSAASEMTLALEVDGSSPADVYGSIDWEEVSR